ncbi:MAG: discoidin domain-containing protein [Elusimicrobiota bacterium]
MKTGTLMKGLFIAVILISFFSVSDAKYIRTWLLCGPFAGGIDGEYIPGEKEIAASEGAVSSGKKWIVYSSLETAVNLMDETAIGVYNESNAYAYIGINSPSDKTARLLLGSDDGVKVWVNGVLVLRNDIPRALKLDEDKLIVNLKKGKNRLLLKIRNIGGGWFLSANITDMSGKSISGLTFNPAQEDLIRVPVKKIIYSAVQGDDLIQYSPVFMLDGNETTRWSSGFSDEERATFDFGEITTITKAAIQWENAYASSYELLISKDGLKWDRMYATDKGKGGKEYIKLANPAAGRYMRINFLRRATSWGNSIFELYLFGRANREYDEDYYEKSVGNIQIERDLSIKQPLQFNKYPKKVSVGKDAEVEVEWTEAPSSSDYRMVIQLENWDLSPGICQTANVDQFETKGKKTVMISIPKDIPKIEGYRFVVAFISKTKNWDDVSMMIATQKDVEVVK